MHKNVTETSYERSISNIDLEIDDLTHISYLIKYEEDDSDVEDA